MNNGLEKRLKAFGGDEMVYGLFVHTQPGNDIPTLVTDNLVRHSVVRIPVDHQLPAVIAALDDEIATAMTGTCVVLDIQDDKFVFGDRVNTRLLNLQHLGVRHLIVARNNGDVMLEGMCDVLRERLHRVYIA
jgi:hypothetical protein